MDTPDGLDRKLWGANDKVQGCAKGDQMFYNEEEQVCECTGIYKCPFQNKNTIEKIEDGVVYSFALCDRYRPIFDKKK